MEWGKKRTPAAWQLWHSIKSTSPYPVKAPTQTWHTDITSTPYIFFSDYFLRSRRNNCFKEIPSLRVIFIVKFLSVSHTYHLLPRNLLSEVLTFAFPLKTWKNLPKLPWKPPFTHPLSHSSPKSQFWTISTGKFPPAPKNTKVEFPIITNYSDAH